MPDIFEDIGVLALIIIFCLGVGYIAGMVIPRGCSECTNSIIEIEICKDPCMSCRQLLDTFKSTLADADDVLSEIDRLDYCLEPGHRYEEVCK